MSTYHGLMIDDQPFAYLGQMSRTGLFGETVDDVIRHLILAGIQRAVEIGAIDVAMDELPEVEEAPSHFKCRICEDGATPPPTLTPAGNCPACGDYCLPF